MVKYQSAWKNVKTIKGEIFTHENFPLYRGYKAIMDSNRSACVNLYTIYLLMTHCIGQCH